MLLEAFEDGPAATIGYLVADDADGPVLAIDAPLGATAAMVEQARQWQRPITQLVSTHAHWDHVLDNAELVRQTRARYGIHADSAPLLDFPQTRLFGLDYEMNPVPIDFSLRAGEPVVAGQLRFEVLECPGHCPGSVVLYEPREKIAFTGDVLFAGSIGRTDLWGGDHGLLLRSIREKLWPLDDEVRVFPGHGPATTIGRERRQNPFLQG